MIRPIVGISLTGAAVRVAHAVVLAALARQSSPFAGRQTESYGTAPGQIRVKCASWFGLVTARRMPWPKGDQDGSVIHVEFGSYVNMLGYRDVPKAEGDFRVPDMYVNAVTPLEISSEMDQGRPGVGFLISLGASAGPNVELIFYQPGSRPGTVATALDTWTLGQPVPQLCFDHRGDPVITTITGFRKTIFTRYLWSDKMHRFLATARAKHKR